MKDVTFARDLTQEEEKGLHDPEKYDYVIYPTIKSSKGKKVIIILTESCSHSNKDYIFDNALVMMRMYTYPFCGWHADKIILTCNVPKNWYCARLAPMLQRKRGQLINEYFLQDEKETE